jgi:ectoine hydroxylase-related dioxygenase (phytanoyl-CoA dioxygenase family)
MQEVQTHATTVREQLASYEEHGYLVLDGVVRVELIDALRAIVEQKIASHQQTFTLLSNRRALSVHDVPVARQIVQEFCVGQRELLVELVGSGALVTDMSVLIAKAGCDAQMLHRDSMCLKGEECNLLIPLEPLTELNGATQFVPGSQWGRRNERYGTTILELQLRSRKDHKDWCLRNLRLAMKIQGRKRTARALATYPFGQAKRRLLLGWSRLRHGDRTLPDEDIDQFIAEKGDVLVYSASLIHRGGANGSQADRYVLGVLLKENRNNHRAAVEYFEDEHDDFYTANMKDCGTVGSYLDGAA